MLSLHGPAVLKCLAMVEFLKNNLNNFILKPNKNELIMVDLIQHKRDAIACLLDLISVG
ncbi:hypothetical protein CRC_00804 [Cylindrospermopsis raciborskii CS-505]|nr:hypothetical protein CRC_00804 [Cylindrospermopsis raciborskii CS-505]